MSEPQADPDERILLSVDEAMAALDVDEDGRVHCLMDATIALVGTDWPVDDVRQLFEEHGVEVAGPLAMQLRHGVSVRVHGGTFFRTRTEWNARYGGQA